MSEQFETAEERNQRIQAELEQLDGDFLNADVQDGDVPDGTYQIVIERVYFGKTKKQQNVLKWELGIVGPTCTGRKLYQSHMMVTSDNLKWLKSDLAKCGMDVSGLRLSDLVNRLEELIGIFLEVKVKNDGKYTNVYFQKRIEIQSKWNANEDGTAREGQASPEPDDLPF